MPKNTATMPVAKNSDSTRSAPRINQNQADSITVFSSASQHEDKLDYRSVIPGDPENHFFVNDAFLDAFSKKIYLVNTARGIVLRIADLVKHLKSGKVFQGQLVCQCGSGEKSKA